MGLGWGVQLDLMVTMQKPTRPNAVESVCVRRFFVCAKKRLEMCFCLGAVRKKIEFLDCEESCSSNYVENVV